jgi:hypothetical protein
MKKIFRLVSMLAVTGLAFAYTSCTDYSEDINQLEQTVIANNDAQSKALKEAQENLQKAVDAANAEITALKSQDASIEAALAALETKHDQDIKDVLAKHAADVAAMQASYDALKAQHNTDKAALETKISNVETAYKNAVAALKAQHDEDIDALKKQMSNDKDALQKAIAQVESDYKAAVSAEAKAREDAVKELNAQIAALNTKLDESIKTLTERVAKDEEALKAAVSSIENLSAQHKNDVAALQGQINTNAKDIDALEALVDGIIDETIPAVKAQVDSLAEDAAAFKTQVAATYATKDALKTVQDALGALEGRVTVVEATQEKFAKQLENLDETVKALAATHKTDVENLQKAIADLKTAVEKAQTTADKAVADAAAAQADATKALGNIQALKDALGQYAEAGKLAEAIAALEDADDGIVAAYSAADKKTNDKVDSLYAVVDAQLKALVDADEEMAAAIEKLNEEKFNTSDFATAFKEAYEARFADDFEDAFEAALAEAVENGGVVDASIKSQVADALTAAKAYTDAVDEKVDAAIENIKELKDAVSALADRIQSIVIVPENGAYGAGEVIIADLVIVSDPETGSHKMWAADSVTVSATYEVYPAKAVSKVTAENTTVKFVAIGKGSVQAAVAGNVVSVVPSNEDGRVKITAKLPSTIYTEAESESEGWELPIVGSLSVAVNDKGTSTVDETVIETGTNVESEYNSVCVRPIDLIEAYVLYDGKKELNRYNADSTFAWDLAGTGNDVFTPFEGYSWYIKDGEEGSEKYYTPAEFAEAYNLSAEALTKITPVMTAKTTFTTASNKYFEVVTDGSIDDLAEVSTSMVQEEVYAAKNRGVGSVATTTVESTVAGFKIFGGSVVSEYTIGKRTISMNIEDFELPWTYEVAKALSTAMTPAGAYTEDICVKNEDFMEIYPDFKERTVTFSPSIEKYSDPTSENFVDFNKILSTRPVSEVKLNGTTITNGPEMEVSALASLKAQVAQVAVSDGYKFAQGSKNVYEFTDTYSYEEDMTDVKVNFTLTLGAMPKNAKVQLPDYVTTYNAAYNALDPSATPSYKVGDWGTALSNTAEVKPYFKTADFQKALYDYDYPKENGTDYFNNCTSTRVSGTVTTDIKNLFNRLEISAAPVPFNYASVYLSNSAFTSATDYFQFTATYKTWFGPVYTVGVNFKFEMPAYSLKYVPDWVANSDSENDGVVTLDGIEEMEGKYVAGETVFDYLVKTDDLSKYFGINGMTADNAADAMKYLTVSYEINTEADAKLGIENVPADPSGEYKVEDAKGTISECELEWGDFTARELDLTATLKYGGIVLGTKDLKLVTEDPIDTFKGLDYKVTRDSHKTYTVNLYDQIRVTSITGKSMFYYDESVSPKVRRINEPFVDAYDIVFKFAEKCSVTVGGVSTTLPAKFSYNPEDGTIVYEADAAVQDKPVVATVTAQLTHKYGYKGLNNDTHTATFTVTFNPAE